MGTKMDKQILPITRVKGMAYYIGADGFVYEAVKGNAGRPKKVKKMPISDTAQDVSNIDNNTSGV